MRRRGGEKGEEGEEGEGSTELLTFLGVWAMRLFREGRLGRDDRLSLFLMLFESTHRVFRSTSRELFV
jgi:hypothetical protein